MNRLGKMRAVRRRYWEWNRYVRSLRVQADHWRQQYALEMRNYHALRTKLMMAKDEMADDVTSREPFYTSSGSLGHHFRPP